MAEQQINPPARQQVLSLAQGFMGSAALRTGLDLEIFTQIAHGSDTAEALAAAKNLSVRAVRILCDALVAFGVLVKSDGRYTLTPVAQMLLVKGAPAYLGGMAAIMMNQVMWAEAGRLTDIVKHGHALVEHGAEAADNPAWQDFAHQSHQMAAVAGAPLAEMAAALFPQGGPRRILDLACGSGMYGLSALKRCPGAKLALADWPTVLEIAASTAKKMGLEERVELRPGDIFSADLGGGYDLIIAANIYHHFSAERNAGLSRRLYAATAPGGALILVESVPDEARERERFALVFALTMLVWTRDGDAYTLSEYERMLKLAGYHGVELRPIEGSTPFQAVIARK